jgi:hypothetical protein
MAGTKAAVRYRLQLPPAGAASTIRLRLSSAGQTHDRPFDAEFDRTLAQRIDEADAFHAGLDPPGVTAEERLIIRQARAGLLWSRPCTRGSSRSSPPQAGAAPPDLDVDRRRHAGPQQELRIGDGDDDGIGDGGAGSRVRIGLQPDLGASPPNGCVTEPRVSGEVSPARAASENAHHGHGRPSLCRACARAPSVRSFARFRSACFDDNWRRARDEPGALRGPSRWCLMPRFQRGRR